MSIVKNYSKKKIIQVFTFLALFAILDFAVGALLKKLYKFQEIGTAGQLNETFYKTRADIVVLGNSRAQHHYNDKIIKSITGNTCINSGTDGGYGIWIAYASIDALLKRYTPKLLVVEFNPASAGYWAGNYERLTVLLPFAREFSVCKSLVMQRSKWENFKCLSSVYPYNSMAYSLITGKLFQQRLSHVKGFMPIKDKSLRPLIDTGALFTNFADRPDPLCINSLQSILKMCQETHTKVIFINSPVFKGSSVRLINQTTAAKAAIKLIDDAGFQYWDFSQESTIVSNPLYFADQVHLNQPGADFFSAIISKKIKAALN